MKLSDMGTDVTLKKINKIVESRFGFQIDFDNLTYGKAKRLSRALSESMSNIKKSYGSSLTERNPKYVELMLVKEGLDCWMKSEQGLFESEMGRSEAVLAAKDLVDSVQDMLEKVSKMQNEQMPALLDTIRDQIGTEQADQFKSSFSPLLATLYQALSGGREEADTAVRVLAGEQVQQPMDMGREGGQASSGQMPSEPEAGQEQGEYEADQFAATDAAAGGEEELGRRRR
jgi:hypothetical protein